MEYCTIEELSLKIHKSVKSIRSDRVRNPDSLPPAFTVKGSRRLLFINVDEWLAIQAEKAQMEIAEKQSQITHGHLNQPTKTQQKLNATPAPKKNLGRPRNSSRVKELNF